MRTIRSNRLGWLITFVPTIFAIALPQLPLPTMATLSLPRELDWPRELEGSPVGPLELDVDAVLMLRRARETEKDTEECDCANLRPPRRPTRIERAKA